MKTHFTKPGITVLVAITLLLAAQFATAKAQADKRPPALTPAVSDQANTPVLFIENVGQFGDGARFQVRGGNHTLWLADDAIWLTVLAPVGAATSAADQTGIQPPALAEATQPDAETLQGVHIKLSFPGANPQPALEPLQPLTTTLSYFLGADPAAWRSNVPVWGGVRYANLYPGIDLEVSGAGAFNLVCHTTCESALQQVQLQVEGVTDLSLEDNNLRMDTPVGAYSLPLLTISNPQGHRLTVADLTPIRDGFTVINPFAAGRQPQKSDILAPTDNPEDLLYSTYLGGNSKDVGYGIAVDENGHAYITGETYNGTFPTTPGAFDTSFNGLIDAFVVKLNPTGNSLVYGTFLGSVDGFDFGVGIAVNDDGNAYVVGKTDFSGFPTTPGAFDTSHNSPGLADAFVTKLNPSGTALVYSTYLGGSLGEGGSGIALDEAGNVYIAGGTQSTNFPTTPDAFDTSHNGSGDTFVTKLNAAGSALVYSTFLGSSGSEGASGIVVDAFGNATVGGSTESAAFPTTPGAFDTSFNGVRDLFVARLAPDGSALLYSTFLGGVNYDGGGKVALGPAGSVYVTGMTGSANFPVTPGAFDTSYNSINYDAFLAQLDASGSSLLYGSFLGGSSWDEGQAITADAAGNVYLTGETSSATFGAPFPTTADAFDASYNGGQDVFVVKMNPAIGNGMLYSTYLGGGSDDEGMGLAVDSQGEVYVTGEAFSTAFPVTAGAWDTSQNGDSDGFVSKLALSVAPASLAISGPTAGIIGLSHTLTATVNPPDTTWPLTYTWTTAVQPPVVQVNGRQDVLSFTWSATGPHTITVTAANAGGVVTATHTLTLYTPVQAGFVATPTSGIAPLSVHFSNLSMGDYDTCSWDFGDGLTSDVCADPDHLYAAGLYTVTLTASGQGGVDSLVQTNTMTVYEPVQANFNASPTTGPAPLAVSFSNLSSGDYDSCLWTFGDGSAGSDCTGPDHTYTASGSYTVTLALSGLGGTDSLTRTQYITVHTAVQASFDASPTAGVAPTAVNFSNLSTGDYDTCAWDFGDSGSSTLCPDPAHTYTTPGVYTVTLTVSGPGGTDSLSQAGLVTIYAPVTAGFSGMPTSGIAPLSVAFSNLSNGDFDTCAWDFGDGGASSDCAGPGHIYTAGGSYTVTLTVSGPGGTDTLTQTNTITVYAPVTANFSASPTSGIAPLSVHFTNLSTGDYDTCLWAFGDGGSSVGCDHPDHLYVAAGMYTVTLTVSGSGGNHSLAQTGLIAVYEPVATSFSASPASGIAPLTVTFSNLSTGDFDTCLWDFGDGSSGQMCQPTGHVYGVPGMYTVTLTVSGPGGMDSLTQVDAVAVYEPAVAAFSASPPSGTVPLAVHFANLSTGNYDTCLWDFGDGSTSSVCTGLGHLYATPGTYTVTLTIMGTGGSDIVAHYVTVQPHQLFLPIVWRAEN